MLTRSRLRRIAVLFAVACAALASVATSSGPLWGAYARSPTQSTSLAAGETRYFQIEVRARSGTLPPSGPFRSSLRIGGHAKGEVTTGTLGLVLQSDGDEAPLETEAAFDVYPSAALPQVEDLLATCARRENCERTFILALTAKDGPLDFDWDVEAELTSDYEEESGAYTNDILRVVIAPLPTWRAGGASEARETTLAAGEARTFRIDVHVPEGGLPAVLASDAWDAALDLGITSLAGAGIVRFTLSGEGLETREKSLAVGPVSRVGAPAWLDAPFASCGGVTPCEASFLLTLTMTEGGPLTLGWAARATVYGLEPGTAAGPGDVLGVVVTPVLP